MIKFTSKQATACAFASRFGAALCVLAVLFFVASPIVEAATFGFRSHETEMRVGETVTVSLTLVAPDPLAAVEVWVAYPKELLEVIEIRPQGEAMPLVVQSPEYDNGAGLLTYVAGRPGAGFEGEASGFLEIVFRAHKSGTGIVTYEERTQGALADGFGTADIVQSEDLSVTVRPPSRTLLLLGGAGGTALLLFLLFVVAIHFWSRRRPPLFGPPGHAEAPPTLAFLYSGGGLLQGSPLVYRLTMLVFFATSLLVMPFSVAAAGATLGIDPAAQVVSVGESIRASVVLLNPNKLSINAVGGTLRYSSDLLFLTGTSKEGGSFSLWAVGPEAGGPGTVVFASGSPQPVNASRASVFSLTFRVLAPGSPTIAFEDPSVLLADGKGTEVATPASVATWTTIKAAPLPPAPAPQKTTPKKPASPAIPQEEKTAPPAPVETVESKEGEVREETDFITRLAPLLDRERLLLLALILTDIVLILLVALHFWEERRMLSRRDKDHPEEHD